MAGPVAHHRNSPEVQPPAAVAPDLTAPQHVAPRAMLQSEMRAARQNSATESTAFTGITTTAQAPATPAPSASPAIPLPAATPAAAATPGTSPAASPSPAPKPAPLLTQTDIDHRINEMLLSRSSWGWSDKERIIAALDRLTPEQGDQLAEAFKKRVGKPLETFLKEQLDKSGWTGSDKQYLIRAIDKLKGFDAKRTAQDLYEAMSGLGTDENAVRAALNPLTREQAAKVREAFRELYKADLVDDYLKGDFSGTDEKLVTQKFAADSSNQAAEALHDLAHPGWRWENPDNLVIALETIPPAEMAKVREDFLKHSGGIPIERDLYNAVAWWGHDDATMVKMVTLLYPEQKAIAEEAGKLFLAMHGPSATTETVQEVLAQFSHGDRQQIEEFFDQHYAHAWGPGESLRTVLSSEFSAVPLSMLYTMLDDQSAVGPTTIEELTHRAEGTDGAADSAASEEDNIRSPSDAVQGEKPKVFARHIGRRGQYAEGTQIPETFKVPSVSEGYRQQLAEAVETSPSPATKPAAARASYVESLKTDPDLYEFCKLYEEVSAGRKTFSELKVMLHSLNEANKTARLYDTIRKWNPSSDEHRHSHVNLLHLLKGASSLDDKFAPLEGRTEKDHAKLLGEIDERSFNVSSETSGK